MPRRSVMTTAQLAVLCALPATDVAIARQYTLGERDLAIIRQRHGAANRLGFIMWTVERTQSTDQ